MTQTVLLKLLDCTTRDKKRIYF